MKRLQFSTLRFALYKEQYLQLKDFSRAWIGMVVATIGENVSHTGQNSLLPMRLFIPNPSFRTSFRSLITCRAAQIHTFHSVAPMVVLTNLRIGTEHRSWVRNTIKKEVTRAVTISHVRIERWLVAYAAPTVSQMLKSGRKSNINNAFSASFFIFVVKI